MSTKRSNTLQYYWIYPRILNPLFYSFTEDLCMYLVRSCSLHFQVVMLVMRWSWMRAGRVPTLMYSHLELLLSSLVFPIIGFAQMKDCYIHPVNLSNFWHVARERRKLKRGNMETEKKSPVDNASLTKGWNRGYVITIVFFLVKTLNLQAQLCCTSCAFVCRSKHDYILYQLVMGAW